MIRRPLVRAGCASVVLVAGLARCTSTSRTAPPTNVLLVTLDTTRADRLSIYGFQTASMPAMERLAREGVVFQRATTVAPLTLPAHCSLLTGLYPLHHGVRDNADLPLDAAHPTLAQMLHDRGFRTAAFVASSVLASDRGVARGFDTYRDTRKTSDAGSSLDTRRPGNEVVDEALTWLTGHEDRPFFAWVHLYDAHAPYRPPEPFRSRYAADPYEGGLAFADSQVNRLIEWLESQHQLDRTLVIVAGDHGEALGDHGELEHGMFLYESVMHVPLVMRVPGVAPRRIDGITSLVDVLPTVLGLLGLPAGAGDGLDLSRAIRRGEEPSDRVIYSESLYPRRFGWAALRAVRAGQIKFIEAPRPEVYDLNADAFEEHDLSHDRPDLVATMRARLETLVHSAPPDRVEPQGARAAAPDELRALRSLGYVSSSRASSATAISAPDPKDYIQAYNKMMSHAARAELTAREASRTTAK
jgi:arylsulfatase A-like enzyme